MYTNKYSNFWRRFFAILVDSIVFLPLEWIDDYVLSGVINSGGVFAWGVAYSLIGITYYVGMHVKYGQTIGKMVTRVKVVDISESRNLTLKQSCMRDIVPIILIPFQLYLYAQLSFNGETWESLEQGRALIFFGYIMIGWVILEFISMLFNHKRRAIHDFIAGSVVVKKV
ncbi:RDD family protein [Vibrio lentus]|uniref:RDD family protein n=1 Tax=Vibrio lentus TaxID=136468 RepID=UPI000C8564D5|nr:RDD family protein [Vibrio lentus]PMI42185.1 hypothetical protein BCU45_16780 [Vibrio lentus]PMJ57557.1 hypothetical protein BCU20_15350 [Vibrio lentus]